MEWEDGGNRSLQIAEVPCSVEFEWGDEGSLRVEACNGSENDHVEVAPAPEQSPQVPLSGLSERWLVVPITMRCFSSIEYEMA